MKPFQTARFNKENYHIITAIRLEAIMSSIDSGRALELVCQVVQQVLPHLLIHAGVCTGVQINLLTTQTHLQPMQTI